MGGGIPSESRFIPRPDDDAMLREAKEITAETTNKCKVAWDGIDPDTGKPWEPSWVSKSDCTNEAVAQWEAKKGKVKSKNAGSGSARSKLGAAFLPPLVSLLLWCFQRNAERAI
ncbi:hypothetical protein J3R83DRAFT_5786 [Lanmaoa asiatica]|nr:hypothetical protein J3R83DRAFT_11750 [Lanmaoa asiatica]KAH0825788.1 hypothetical protein J3R83DRAFT_8831 [Lanmaoa asiatica]KAH0826062.1 hypothetical protein J3R83DRAFT_5786 [Lanmaoa asiatica]